MHRKHFSHHPYTDRVLIGKKKEITIGGVRMTKNFLNNVSKSEKNSPSSRIPGSSLSRNSILKHPSPKEKSEKVSPKNIKLLKIQNLKTLKKTTNESPGLQFRQSPKNSPKTTFLKHKKSRPNIFESSKSNPSLQTKIPFEKEREILIRSIKKHFDENPVELLSDLGYYSLVKLLGQGAFGKVMLGIQILTEKKVAMKAISRAYLENELSRRKIFREVYILKKIRSNFVVKILEVFESQENFLIVMEYMPGGDLLNYLKKNGRMSEDLAKKIFYQVIQGAVTIHKYGILHRDFKLDNILLDRTMTNIKICDFGVSKLMHKGEIIMDQCGTPAYLAPEIVLDKGYEGFWSDI